MAPAYVSNLADATLSVGRDLLHSAEVTARFPTPQWAFRTSDCSLAVLDLKSSVNPVPALDVSQATAEVTAEETAEVTAAVADIVHDRLCGHEFIQWPTCPNHHHPLRPAVSADTAWWTCPATAEHIVRIGSLGEFSG